MYQAILEKVLKKKTNKCYKLLKTLIGSLQFVHLDVEQQY